MAAGAIADVLSSRANINDARRELRRYDPSRDTRNQRLRRATRQRAPRDLGDEPLRMLVRALARQAARERFEREVAAERETQPEVTLH
jgi:hypothetical protein